MSPLVPDDGSYRSFQQMDNDCYRYMVFRDSRLVGAILMGEMGPAAAIKRMIEAKTSCGDLLHGNPDMKEILAFIEASPSEESVARSRRNVPEQ